MTLNKPLSRALLIAAAVILFNPSYARTIHKEQSLYRNIMVTKTGQKICMKFSLRTDRKQNQSCKLLNNPDFLVFDYAKLAVAGFLMADDPKNILIIGLGGGTLVEAFHSLSPDAKITSVEIDPAVVKVAKEYFHLPLDAWHTIVEKDGRIFIKREKLRGNKYDLIVLDAFNGDYIPEHLMTLEFFKEVKSVLTDDGLVISNTFSTSILYDYESSTYSKAFGDFYQLKGKFSGNRLIVTGNKKLPSRQQFKEITLSYKEHIKKMDIRPEYLWMALEVNPNWNKSSPALTDDFAPVNILKD
jgi:spermidine synthase